MAVLLALTVLPAATMPPSRAILAGDVPPLPVISPTPTPTPTPDPPSPDPDPEPPADPDALAAYRGLGTWIDMYDNTHHHPVAAVKKMKAKGVRTIYVETANFHRPRDGSKLIYRARMVGRVIEAAHRRGMRVVAWYLPGFENPRRDYRRSMAAIRFRSPNGERFDSFALDIEYNGVSNLTVRNRRMLRLSRQLDKAVDATYALGAIVPEAHALYWRNFPYARVARSYDVFLPMAYYTFRVDGPTAVRRWMRNNVREIRRETGDPKTPVHAIGGLSADSSIRGTRAFLDAALDTRSIGASLYSFPGMRAEQWRVMARANAGD